MGANSAWLIQRVRIMSSSILSSILSGSTTASQQIQELKNSGTSALLGSLGTSTSTSNLTKLACSGSVDSCLLSAISQSLNSIAGVAKESGLSDLMGNVRQFAMSMKNDGVDTVTILKHLSSVRELAASDPESFRNIFANSETSNTDTTMDAIDEET